MPKDNRYSIATKVSEDEKKKIDSFVADKDITIAQLLRWATLEYIKNHED